MQCMCVFVCMYVWCIWINLHKSSWFTNLKWVLFGLPPTNHSSDIALRGRHRWTAPRFSWARHVQGKSGTTRAAPGWEDLKHVLRWIVPAKNGGKHVKIHHFNDLKFWKIRLWTDDIWESWLAGKPPVLYNVEWVNHPQMGKSPARFARENPPATSAYSNDGWIV